tara:strand:- start:315 stop:860 length:546 start_codon:yes stop_codon:yes gene_type:complete
LKKGNLLISNYTLINDLEFNRSVILLTRNDGEGSIGFVINKKSTYKICDLDTEYKDIKAKIYYGGPVSVDTIHFIHKKNSFVTGSEKISNEIYWGKDFNEIIKLIRQNKVEINDVKFFIGYSGWEQEQLERELDENSWLILKKYNSNDIFKTKNELWKNKLISFGEKYKLWANSPENPNYN